MRRWLKQGMAWLAIYAVALHVILLGFAPIAASGTATFDPTSFICHSLPSGDADQGQDKSGFVPSQACEHCNLCSAMAPPPVPDPALIGTVRPASVLGVLRPAPTAVRTGAPSDPKQARGPPRFV
jgi:hypothetical protein